MNKIYKTVWNALRHTLVVVGEFSSNTSQAIKVGSVVLAGAVSSSNVLAVNVDAVNNHTNISYDDLRVETSFDNGKNGTINISGTLTLIDNYEWDPPDDPDGHYRSTNFGVLTANKIVSYGDFGNQVQNRGVPNVIYSPGIVQANSFELHGGDIVNWGHMHLGTVTGDSKSNIYNYYELTADAISIDRKVINKTHENLTIVSPTLIVKGDMRAQAFDNSAYLEAQNIYGAPVPLAYSPSKNSGTVKVHGDISDIDGYIQTGDSSSLTATNFSAPSGGMTIYGGTAQISDKISTRSSVTTEGDNASITANRIDANTVSAKKGKIEAHSIVAESNLKVQSGQIIADSATAYQFNSETGGLLKTTVLTLSGSSENNGTITEKSSDTGLSISGSSRLYNNGTIQATTLVLSDIDLYNDASLIANLLKLSSGELILRGTDQQINRAELIGGSVSVEKNPLTIKDVFINKAELINATELSINQLQASNATYYQTAGSIHTTQGWFTDSTLNFSGGQYDSKDQGSSDKEFGTNNTVNIWGAHTTIEALRANSDINLYRGSLAVEDIDLSQSEHTFSLNGGSLITSLHNIFNFSQAPGFGVDDETPGFAPENPEVPFTAPDSVKNTFVNANITSGSIVFSDKEVGNLWGLGNMGQILQEQFGYADGALEIAFSEDVSFDEKKWTASLLNSINPDDSLRLTFAQAVLESDSDSLVIGTSDNPADTTIAGSVGVSRVVGADSVTVNDGKHFVLVGDQAGSRLVEGGKVFVENASKLTLGLGAIDSTKGLLDLISLSDDSSLNAKNGHFTVAEIQGGLTEIESDAAILTNKLSSSTVNYGTLSAAKDSLEIHSKLDNKGLITSNHLLVSDGALIDNSNLIEGKAVEVQAGVLNNTAQIRADNLIMNGGTMNLLSGSASFNQAEFNGGVLNIADASTHAFSADTIGTKISVSKTGQLTLGGQDGLLIQNALKHAEGNRASLGISSPISLNGGALHIGSLSNNQNKASTDSTLSFGSDSLLVVNTSFLGGNAAITNLSDSGAIDLESGAHLHLANASWGKHIITEGFDTTGIDLTNWELSWKDTITSDPNCRLEVFKDEDTIWVVAGSLDIRDELPNIIIPDTVNDVISNKQDTGSDDPVIGFISQAVDDTFVDPGIREDLLNSVGSFGYSVSPIAYQMANMVSDATDKHLSFMDYQFADGQFKSPDGVHLWIDTLAAHLDKRQFGISGNSGQSHISRGWEGNTSGLILGADLVKQKEGVRYGVALHAQRGRFDTKNDALRSNQRTEAYGLSLYSAKHTDKYNLIGSVNFSYNNSEVSGSLPATMTYKDIDADVDVYTVSLSGRFEGNLHYNGVNIIPHIGARAIFQRTGAYETKLDNQAAFETSKSFAAFAQIPVGITVNANFVQPDGWTIKPHADATVTTTIGDINHEVDFRGIGHKGIDPLTMDLVDRVSGTAELGVSIWKDNVTAGVSYSATAGSHRLDHQANAHLRIEF